MNLALNSKLHHDLQRLWGRHTRKSVSHRFSGKASNRSFVSNFVPKLARKGSSEHNRGEQLTAARLAVRLNYLRRKRTELQRLRGRRSCQVADNRRSAVIAQRPVESTRSSSRHTRHHWGGLAVVVLAAGFCLTDCSVWALVVTAIVSSTTVILWTRSNQDVYEGQHRGR